MASSQRSRCSQRRAKSRASAWCSGACACGIDRLQRRLSASDVRARRGNHDAMRRAWSGGRRSHFLEGHSQQHALVTERPVTLFRMRAAA